MNEDLFRQALLRQLRQTDRFEETFGLVLLMVDAPQSWEPSWALVTDALAPALRATDIVGWFNEGSVIGVIRSRLDMDHLETGATLQVALERVLTSRLSATDVKHVTVRAEVYLPGGTALTLLRDVLEQAARPSQPARSLAKRMLDIACGTALLALSAPVMLAVAAAVKWSSAGPVLVRQERIGQRGRPFTMLKFRTMQFNVGHEAHERFVSEYIRGGSMVYAADGGPVFKLVADPRITRVGRFLRRSSLDELPQLWNIVKGDMSLVGPRPPLAYEVRCYKAWHRRRMLEAKPGLTGLWQVKGRSRTTFDEMVRLDLRYARTQCFWSDLKILMATPRAVFSGEGAR